MGGLEFKYIYPLLYICFETFLVVFINYTSSGRRAGYNTITINFLAELIKLLIALCLSAKEGSLSTLKNVKKSAIAAFSISNLMYAINNNIFHHCMSILPPALFTVAVNSIRTTITSFLQSFVSGPLTCKKYAACCLLVLSFVVVSIPDLIRVYLEGSFMSSQLCTLVVWASLYSTISAVASLWQEAMLKESPTVMQANVINYSIGMMYQGIGLIYCKLIGKPIMNGVGVFYVQLIPPLMALSGLSISLVLKYFDNIVKLISNSLAVLLVHSITLQIAGLNPVSIPFLLGWLTSLPAGYLYNSKSNQPTHLPTAIITQIKESSAQTKEVLKTAPATTSLNKGKTGIRWGTGVLYVGFVLVGIALRNSFLQPSVSTLNWKEHGHRGACVLTQSSREDPQSNLKYALKQKARSFGTQFAVMNPNDGLIHIDCPGKLFTLKPQTDDPDSESWQEHNFSHHVEKNAEDKILSWDLIGNEHPYVWLWCDSYMDANLAIRPPLQENGETQQSLTKEQINELSEHITVSSHSFSPHLKQADSQTRTPTSTIDSVLIVYWDSVSAAKFNFVFKETLKTINSLQGNITSHVSFPLTKYHSLGINSVPNYVPMFSGVNPDTAFEYFETSERGPYRGRAVWLSDVAELMGFRTLSLYGGCQSGCKGNCVEKLTHFENIEIGGYTRQYMQDSGNRLPADDIWPSAAQCEGTYRAKVREKSFSTAKKVVSSLKKKWIANRYPTYYYFSWFRAWLVAYANVTHISKSPGTRKPVPSTHSNGRFGVMTLQDTHTSAFDKNWDDDFATLLSDLFVEKQDLYGTRNTAMLLLSDHGLHFGDEYVTGVGRLMNKQPMGYVILPQAFLKENPDQAVNIQSNSRTLVTGLDLRVTVLNWLTQREWSADELLPTNQSKLSYASKYGKSIMTTRFKSDRSCQDAGIPASFCGCNTVACSGDVLGWLGSSWLEIATSVVAFIDQKASFTEEQKLICQPLKATKLRLVSGVNNCVMNSHSYKELNFFVTQGYTSLLTLSVSLQLFPDQKFKVTSVDTAGEYAPFWSKCEQLFNERGIAHQITNQNEQYCYCFLESWSWEQFAMNIIKMYFS